MPGAFEPTAFQGAVFYVATVTLSPPPLLPARYDNDNTLYGPTISQALPPFN